MQSSTTPRCRISSMRSAVVQDTADLLHLLFPAPARLFQTMPPSSLEQAQAQKQEDKMQSMKSTMAKSSIPYIDQRENFWKLLQPKNFNSGNTPTSLEKPQKINILLRLASEIRDENKENLQIGGSFDASLAEELVAMRRKMERLREEREKTEKILMERDHLLVDTMRETERRRTEQQAVQIEVDSIRRLKKLNDA